MSSRVRLIGVIEGQVLANDRFIKHMQSFKKSKGVILPEELRKAPRWQRAQYLFTLFNRPNSELIILREPRSCRTSRSQYKSILRAAGFPDPRNIYRAAHRARAAAGGGRYRVVQNEVRLPRRDGEVVPQRRQGEVPMYADPQGVPAMPELRVAMHIPIEEIRAGVLPQGWFNLPRRPRNNPEFNQRNANDEGYYEYIQRLARHGYRPL